MSASTETMVGHGRTSIVYSHGEGRVVKVFPRGEALAEIEQEAAAAALVDELGVPSVHCYGLTEVDGQPGIVFERLTGPSLATIAERDIRRLPAMCRTLAQCHLQMHAAHTGQLPDVRELAAGLLTTPTLSTLRDSEKEWLRTYLRSLPAGDSVLHLDYHPQNVFQHQDGYAIIDWHSVCRGGAAADVAMSVVLMREVELFPGTPPLKLVLYALSRLVILHFYRKSYLATGTVTKAEVQQWITCARVLRLGLLDVPSERRRLLRRIRRAVRKGRR